MTTSRSDTGPNLGWPRRAAALAAALGVSGPLAAQELTLPSGLSAALFDVVLEEAEATGAPDAGTDPEGGEAEPVPEASDEPLNAAPAEAPAASPTGIARFRLVVAGLGGEGAGFERVAADFLWLCEQVALPALAANGWAPAEVVVSLSDRETEFGVADPDATQFFEGFRIDGGACVAQAY